jgi:signal transduction histidine kinase
VGDAIIEHPPLGWVWWGTVGTAALAAWLASMTVFCMKLAGWDGGPRGTWMKRVLAALFILGCAAAYVSLEMDRRWILTGWYAAAAAFFSAFGLAFMVAAWRSASVAHRMAALALAVNIGVGVRDVVVIRFGSSFGDNTLLRYSSLLFGAVLAYVLITRFSSATRQSRDLMRDLERKVSEREAQLRASYAELEEMARQQERIRERASILRDMHDGVGSHITSAIRQLQSGKADPTDVLQTLRDSLDHLKLSIDAMNLPPGDVTALLANLRYRLEPRLAASNLQLQWDVDVLAPLARLDAADMRHLQFIVFEALSNVLQHARASTIRIEARAHEEVTRVRLIDDGQGFDAKLPFRNGLRSMQDRARAIGAQLVVESSEAGSVIELVLASAARAP